MTKDSPTGAASGQTPDWAYVPFRRAAVLGAGVMGSQIAAHLANAGLEVLLLDVTPESIGREGAKNSLVEGAFKAATKMNPEPFMEDAAVKRVTLGNFDDDFDKIGDADWVIEVVVERMDVKKEVLARIEEAASDTAVISSNTSGLPIAEMSADLGDSFKSRFLGTHFFNPPRYLKLFEVIPTPDTDPEVVDRVTAFARVHLGKGIVMAKDTPNFIGNRIGTYAMLGAVEQFESGDFSIEEIDALTGTLIGHAKSATFRTADVVGLDTLRHVTSNLYAAIPEDESRDRFNVPDVLQRLVDLKNLGAKSKAGFYKKEGKTIKSFDPETGEYQDPKEVGFDVSEFKGGALADRLNKLWKGRRPGRAVFPARPRSTSSATPPAARPRSRTARPTSTARSAGASAGRWGRTRCGTPWASTPSATPSRRTASRSPTGSPACRPTASTATPSPACPRSGRPARAATSPTRVRPTSGG